MLTTLVGDSVVRMRVLRNCPIILDNRFTHVELVELYIVDFEIIFGMGWLHDFFASIDCKNRVVKFNFPKDPVVECK